METKLMSRTPSHKLTLSNSVNFELGEILTRVVGLPETTLKVVVLYHRI